MSVMNLSRLRTEATTRVRNGSITSSQWNVWANNAKDHICTKIPLPHLTYRKTISTVSGTRSYYLSDILPNTITSIIDDTNDLAVSERTESELLALDPGMDDTGSPQYYALYGTSCVQAQPSSASVITVVSSSASDTTQKVRIRGLVSSADNYELLTLSGTTPVDGSLQFTELRQVTKDAVTAGKITVSCTISGTTTTLATIPRAAYMTEYQVITLYPVPDGVYSLGVVGTRRPTDLVNDEDVPDIPEVFHELIVLGMQWRAHEHLYDFKRSDELKQLFEMRVFELSKHLSKRPTYVPRLNGRPAGNGSIDVGRFPPEYV